MTKPDEPEAEESVGLGDATMRAAVLSVLVSGLCLAIGALGFFGWRSAFGVAVGGLLATANLAIFARIGQAFVARKGNTAPWGVIAVLKLVVLFGGIWLILKSGVVSGLALACGYGALPIGITVGSLFGPKPPENEGHQTPPAKSGRDVIKAGRRTGSSESDDR